MQYEIIKEPFMLLETTNMLYKFVNGITFADLMERWHLTERRKKGDPRIRRLNRLQEIMDRICVGLNPNDPELRYFFGHVECGCEDVCLAQLLVDSVCTLEVTDFRDNLEAIRRTWRDLQARDVWIMPSSMASLDLSVGPGSPGNLNRQLQSLNYPAHFRADLKKALEHMDETITRLGQLLEPLVEQLQIVYQEESWLFQELLDYWQEELQNIGPLELLTSLGAEEASQGAGEFTRVALSLMNTNMVVALMTGRCAFDLPHNCLVIGSAITPISIITKRGPDLDSISTVLKCISDRNRLEILHQLSIERSYGQALAETLGVDPGNLSRNLAMLHSYGFLKQERGPWRTYYETDQEALRKFLLRAVDKICTKP